MGLGTGQRRTRPIVLSDKVNIWQFVPMSLPHGKFVAGLTATTLAAAFLVRRSYALSSSMPKYTLHVYDHCPFCIRVELLCGIFGINYDRVVYGYGEGAPAEKHGYGDGPVKLTGKKCSQCLKAQTCRSLRTTWWACQSHWIFVPT